ncbi:hypothetical protein [Serratia symbiotica]|uniref:Uncharacterized protein n=1 Tax=Serratia symbiotica TaxID=138074 RepID=A0A7D5SMS0_9GAMM|nr:hypothetical protein [Serratia symbiotica]QLH62293.1 hypothetical protein SYMBAF_04135 [Serratia symbiotica]USS95779.1 hypothetical protein M5J15_00295 [Serratia symbiotica]
MSQSNKPVGENKPQPAEQPKPAPVKPGDFSVDRMLVGDSAEGFSKKSK